MFNSESTWCQAKVFGVYIFWGIFLKQFESRLNSRPARLLILSRLNQYCLRPMTMECLFWRLCLDHVWPSCTLKPAIALKFLKLSQHGLRPISMSCLSIYGENVRTMMGPCLTSFTFIPARPLKCSRLSQHGIKPVSMECLYLGTMPGLVLLPDQLEN